MPHVDMPLADLERYLPPSSAPMDFDAFWQETIAETRSYPLNPQFTPADYKLHTVDTFDVTFAGYGGQSIKGWLLLPRHRSGPLPCVVEFLGYGRGRGVPLDWLQWASAGFANLVMDTRGQGSVWAPGDTADVYVDGYTSHHPGFMTLGIRDPRAYYYRRVFMDGLRAVEAARSHPAIDGRRIATTGRSQGGGIALAVSGLDHEIGVTMPDVPFLCHYQRATQITDAMPYGEIVRYCKVHREQIDTVFHTLSYFDGINFAACAQAQAFFSVGLMDPVCPPSTVFAAYNHYAGPKQIEVYRFNQHEGGETFHELQKLTFLSALWHQ